MVAEPGAAFKARAVVEDNLLAVGVILAVEMQSPRAPGLGRAREVISGLEALRKPLRTGALHCGTKLVVELQSVRDCHPVLTLHGTTDWTWLPIGNRQVAGLVEGDLAVPAMDRDRGSIGRRWRRWLRPRSDDVALHVLVVL
jgi:hypothetical protein